MKLNKTDRDKLRKDLDELLDKVKFDPENRIHIPKGKLNTILFDYDNKEKCKVLGYKTHNLCKIDLSEISFDNVDLSVDGAKDLSNTNVNIDFSKLHYRLAPGYANLYNVAYAVDFTNVDLSIMDILDHPLDSEHVVFDFAYCNFKNTNIDPNFDHIKGSVRFRSCNFSDNCFEIDEKFDVNYTKIENGDKADFYDCIFTNTKATFKLAHSFDSTDIKRSINSFRGCYIEMPEKTVYLKSVEELVKDKERILLSYQAFELRKFSKILEIIRTWNLLCAQNENPEITYNDNDKDFKLNRESIEKLRFKIHNLILGKIFIRKIKLPNNLFEMILFDTTIDNKGNVCKKIALPGDITKLFDYSDISFEDVSLDCNEVATKYDNMVVLNNTAKIDLSKTYEYKNRNQLVANCLFFNGADLQGANMEELTRINSAKFERVSFKDTTIQMNENVNASFIECDLSNVFLGNIQLDLDTKICHFNDNLSFKDCNLRNSDINLVGYNECSNEDYHNVYKDTNYLGCQVNGVEIKSLSDQNETKKQVLLDYSKYSKNTISKTLSMVRKQIRENEQKGEQ